MLRWLKSGALPGAQTAGGHWRVDPAELFDFLAGRVREAHLERRAEGRPPTLLVIEDEPAHADALVRLLEVLVPGGRVHKATDGLTAGLLLGSLEADVAFVDIELPYLDGVEVIRRAVSLAGLPARRFVVISGALTSARRSQLDALGVPATSVLTKPLDPDRLEAVLANLLPTHAEAPP